MTGRDLAAAPAAADWEASSPNEVIQRFLIALGVPLVVFTVLNLLGAIKSWYELAGKTSRGIDAALNRAGIGGALLRLTVIEIVHAVAGALLAAFAIQIHRRESQGGGSLRDALAAILDLDAVTDQPLWLPFAVCGLPVVLTIAALLDAHLLGFLAATGLRCLFGLAVLGAVLVAAAGVAVASMEKSLTGAAVTYEAVFGLLAAYVVSTAMLWPALRVAFDWEPPA